MKELRDIKGYPVFWYVDSLSKLIFEPVVTATGFFLPHLIDKTIKLFKYFQSLFYGRNNQRLQENV